MITTHVMKKIVGTTLLSGAVALAGLGLAAGTAQAFNPQPEPPGKPITSAVHPPDVNTGGIIAVNPQPQRPIRPQVAAQGG